MVATNALLLLVSVIYVGAGLALLVYPTSYSISGVDVTSIGKYLASGINSYNVIPRWAGQLIALSSVLFYATTFPSLHDRVKVARGLLFALVGWTQTSIQDHYFAQQSVFSSLHKSQSTTLAYARIGGAVLLTLWCFVECFAATKDDAQPTKPGAKKNKHASTGAPANNLYLRALSLFWLLVGVLVWFSPSHLSLLGLPSAMFTSTSHLSHFSTAIVGSLYVASSTICGYGATFQSVHDQAKLARSFLWYWLITLGYGLYGQFVAKADSGVRDELMYFSLAVQAVFVVWSLVVSFSATSDDVRNPTVKTTIKKKE